MVKSDLQLNLKIILSK